jgi:ParB-like chromosome segregation protein Spo0J
MTLPTPRHDYKPPDWFLDGENSRDAIVVDDPLRELHGSLIEHGQLHPVGAIDKGDKGIPIWGFRRIACAKLLGGIDKLSVLIYPDTLQPRDISILNATENIQRLENTEPEIFRLANKLMELNSGWSRKDLAAHVHKSSSLITRWLAPNDLIPEAMQAFLEGKFGFAKAYSIVKSSDQSEALDRVLKGETRDGLERINKRNKLSNAAAVRVPSIRVSLVNNTSVVIKGEAIDLDQGIEALKDALKAMTKARDT